MLPDWSHARRQLLTNAVLARYSIPVEVGPATSPDGSRCWQVRVLGGTLEAALERMHTVQDRIIRRFSKHGVKLVSRHDALFMHASQWLEWVIVRREEDLEHADLVELMEGWAALYGALGPGFLN